MKKLNELIKLNRLKVNAIPSGSSFSGVEEFKTSANPQELRLDKLKKLNDLKLMLKGGGVTVFISSEDKKLLDKILIGLSNFIGRNWEDILDFKVTDE